MPHQFNKLRTCTLSVRPSVMDGAGPAGNWNEKWTRVINLVKKGISANHRVHPLSGDSTNEVSSQLWCHNLKESCENRALYHHISVSACLVEFHFSSLRKASISIVWAQALRWASISCRHMQSHRFAFADKQRTRSAVWNDSRCHTRAEYVRSSEATEARAPKRASGD